MTIAKTERDAINRAALPLPPSQRTAFELMVTDELARMPLALRGPGSLHRIIAMAQRAFLHDGLYAVGVAK